MDEIYKHAYINLTEYYVIEIFKGGARIIDNHGQYKHYLDWVADGNTPEKVSGDRFVTIVEGEVVVNPEKENILAAEALLAEHAELRAGLRKDDVTILTHFEQEACVKLHIIPKEDMSLTDEEWEAILTSRQTTRDIIGDN